MAERKKFRDQTVAGRFNNGSRYDPPLLETEGTFMEMNLHAPQSVEAATELREIAAVPLQIISPRESVPIVSVVQDTLVGANRFTRPDVLFNRREAMNLLVHAKRWDGVLPPPAVMDPQPMWNGQQLLSALLPPVNLQMPNGSYTDADKSNPNSQNMVKIFDGKIVQGILDKSVFGKQLLQIVYNDYGPEVTVDFLDSLQAMIANFLMNSGFSVGISDLIADDATNSEIGKELNVLTKKVEDQILQLHMGLFENNSGRSNQEEFEGKLMGTLNQAYSVAGKIGLKSLVETNRMTNMVKAGSKGSDVNVSQMIATLGQQAIEGKRVPNGFQHRTLPHFKRFDDSARARGFITSSYIKGLQPDEFFFHAMSGREGLIDTAVKSVTGDTEVVVMEDGVMKHTAIGTWIDRHLAMNSDAIEHIENNNMECLNLSTEAYIPTADADGKVTWGVVKAVTRHDPGKMLYQIKTRGGKTVTVTESQSLLVWNEASKQFLPKLTPDVTVGEFVPVTASLPAPPTIVSTISVSSYLPKTDYLYGSDYVLAVSAMKDAMIGREHIPSGWWAQNNGSAFTLPYDSKARLQRATVRSDVSNIKEGFVYPFTTNRDHALIPEAFALDSQNGLFMGLFLAEGNVDIKSGYVQITNNDATIRNFVKNWFDSHGIRTSEEVKTNHIGATSSCVRGYSVLLAKLLTGLMGHGAADKHVPSEAFAAPEEFVTAFLNGYFSGDGTLTENSIEASSASERLIDGISMLCTRIGVFGKVFTTKTTYNNLGTQNIQPAYRLAIRAQWASRFAEKVVFIHAEKDAKRKALVATDSHRNFTTQNDVVLDTITEIYPVDPATHPKMYDLTVPSTFNFGLANGLQVRDTADTGYMQRQIRVALEDLISQHDGSVCDATGNILQISYGEDGMNATKLESQPYGLATMSDADIMEMFAAEGAPDAQQYIEDIKSDRKMLVEYVYMNKPQKNVKYPVYLERLILSLRRPFNMVKDAGTVTATEVLAMHKTILNRTHAHNRLWAGLVRFHLSPKKLQHHGYTSEALQSLGEQIVLKHMQAWVEPGQPVGVIAAQSIGEPATQMTLNTFHLAGVAAKSNMTRGVPRLKELLKATHNPKAIELTIPLRHDLRTKKDEARRVAQDIEFTLLQDLVTVSRIYYDPKDSKTLIESDTEWLTYMTAFANLSAPAGTASAADPMAGYEGQEAPEAPKSPWILRFELDREKMFAKNIAMDDIAYILRARLGDATMHYTDYNANRLVFRIRLDDEPNQQIDQLNTLKILQNKILSATAVRGIPGLRAVNYQKISDVYEFNAEAGKYAPVEQYMLISDGSNFLDVLAHPDVDATRVYSSNVHDMLDNLGIEACRAALFKEITTLFAESGSTVNFRHVSILIDKMCHKGRTMSVDRYGIQKNDIGPLAKMSFEQTEDIALRAAMFGEQDPCLGISAKVMLGAPIKAGTCFSEILFDEEVAVNLASSAPVNQRLEHPKPLVAYTDDELDTRLYGDEGDEGPCNLNELRMNVALPNVPLGTVDEGDEEDVEITRV